MGVGGDQVASLRTCAGSSKRHSGGPLGAVRRQGDSSLPARSVLLRLHCKGRHRRPTTAGGGARTSEQKRAWCRHSAFRSDQRFPKNLDMPNLPTDKGLRYKNPKEEPIRQTKSDRKTPIGVMRSRLFAFLFIYMLYIRVVCAYDILASQSRMSLYTFSCSSSFNISCFIPG